MYLTYIYIYLPTPPLGQDMTQGQFRGRIIGFLPFPRVLVLCEMQSVSSRI